MVKPYTIFNVPGYKIFRKDRDDGYGGVAILVKNIINCKEITINNNDDNLQLCGVYYAPGTDTDILVIKDLIQRLHTARILISGDFNSHHYAWGSKHEDKKGMAIYELIKDHYFCILNDGRRTTIQS